MLQDASKALAMCLWLVASEHLDGEIDADSTKLAFRFRTAPEKIEKALKPLIDGGFFHVLQDASKALADCKQDAPLVEAETEGEKSPTPMGMLISLNVEKKIAKDWLTIRKAKRAPLTETALDELKREAEKAGISPADAIFICAKKSWQNFNASWKWQDAAPTGASSKPFNLDDFYKQVGA